MAAHSLSRPSDSVRRIRLPNNWLPRAYQLPAWSAWERGVKRESLIWHRRAGKDDYALHKTAVAAHPPTNGLALPGQRIANYWHCLPEYSQGRKAIWEAVNPHTGKRRIDEAFPKEIRKRTDSQTMSIEFLNGSSWRVVGSDDPNSLVGAPPFGIVFSEWALSNPLAWAYLSPILDENGGWASFITTSRGRNHAFNMHQMAKESEAWFAETLTVLDTKAISLESVEKARKEYIGIFGPEAAESLIEQEYFCSFEAAILGAYWGPDINRAEQAGRIRDVAHEPDLPVHTAWDIGVRDDTGVWLFQLVDGQVLVLDYIRAQNKWAGFYVEELEKRADERGYQWGIDYVPHDIKVREWTNKGPNGEAKTRIQTLIDLGRKPELSPDHHLGDGIDAARRIINHCWFDKTNCEFGIECLRQYKKEWDADKREFKKTPLHDWTSHAADAFRYLAMAVNEVRKVDPPKPKEARGPVTWNELHKQIAKPGKERVY